MADCMYVMTQDELDELESRLEWYKTGEALKAAAEKAIAVLSETFAQVTASVEEILKSFSDWWLEITGAAQNSRAQRQNFSCPERQEEGGQMKVDKEVNPRFESFLFDW